MEEKNAEKSAEMPADVITVAIERGDEEAVFEGRLGLVVSVSDGHTLTYMLGSANHLDAFSALETTGKQLAVLAYRSGISPDLAKAMILEGLDKGFAKAVLDSIDRIEVDVSELLTALGNDKPAEEEK